MHDPHLVMLAHFEDNDRRQERRGSRRRTLNLHVPGGPHAAGGRIVIIHDLSTTGLLLETNAALGLGSPLAIELPHAGRCSATVVWNSGKLFGCQFDTPISKAAVSAALLKSPAPEGGESRFPRAGAAALDDDETGKLPLRTRLWIHIALAALSAILIAGAIALVV